MAAEQTEQPDTLDTAELRMLALFARTGSLTAVAHELGLSQPAVSQRLKRMEMRLGVPLIERCGRVSRLTPVGEVLAGHGARVVAEVDAALAALEDLRGSKSGTLRMVGFPSASATVVPELMRLLRRDAPDVTFQYREAEPPGAAELLRAGEVDVALVFDYAGAGEWPAGSRYVPLWREDVRLVVGEGCAAPADGGSPAGAGASSQPGPADVAASAASSSPVAYLADYAGEAWIAGCEKCRGHLLTVAAEAGFEPQIIQETDNMPALLAMVGVGGAVGLVPQIALAAARQLPEGVRVLQLDPPSTRTIGLLFLGTHEESPQVALVRRLAAELSAQQWGLQPISAS